MPRQAVEACAHPCGVWLRLRKIKVHRIDTPDAAAGGLFTDGDPSVPIPATSIDADWANAIQEEIANVILAAGIGLIKLDNTQLLDAIIWIVQAGITAHEAAADPHPGYLTQAEGDVLYGVTTSYFMGQL